MRKPVPSPYPLVDVIRDRWSPLAFSPRPIPGELLDSLFEAARWAPSSFNEQPWTFLVATQDEPEGLEKMLSCLAEPNQEWARSSYALVCSCAKLAFDRNMKPNRHAQHDVGLATQNLLLQAISLGIYCHPMAGFDVEKVRQLYRVPATHEVLTAIAIGYPADDASQLSPALQQRHAAVRQRKPLKSMVFRGAWGQSDQ